MSKDELTALLNRYHLRPNKRLGQHYLIDGAVLAASIAAAKVQPGEPILEIGAGPGILTKALAIAGAEVLAVEYDRDFCRLLQAEFHNWRNVHVLVDDALRLDFASLKHGGRPYQKMVANIPYQITNPLIRRILSPDSPITVAVLLVQKEVAARLTAPAGSSERGLMTVMVEYYGQIKEILQVQPSAFWPEPRVDSTLIRLDRELSQKFAHEPIKKLTKKLTKKRTLADAQEEQAFFWFVRQCFSGKRKTLTNSMSGGLNMVKATVSAIVKEAAIAPLLRAEDLTLSQWLILFSAYRRSV